MPAVRAVVGSRDPFQELSLVLGVKIRAPKTVPVFVPPNGLVRLVRVQRVRGPRL